MLVKGTALSSTRLRLALVVSMAVWTGGGGPGATAGAGRGRVGLVPGEPAVAGGADVGAERAGGGGAGAAAAVDGVEPAVLELVDVASGADVALDPATGAE